MPLTDKQSAFVAEYLKDKNATQAAIRAGYSAKTAHSQGPRLLENVEVARAVDDGLKALADKAGVTSERVIKELARIAFSDLRNILTDSGNIIDAQDWDDDTAAAIASVEIVARHGSEQADEEQEPQAHGGSLKRNRGPKSEYVHKIKVWDKNSALEKLCKHLDLYAAEKHEHTGKGGGPIQVQRSEEELDARISELLQKAQS